jgi:hypothetical protein|tara:strand:+ start:6069 stop:6302 length:234 start_codon:yes stop_codon:yes gene_type:complete
MKRIYEFRCPEGHRSEKFIDETIYQISCKICKQESTRVVSCRGISLDPISGDYPSTTMKWAKMRQEKIKAERKLANS